MSEARFQNQLALVTGAGGGLGRAISARLSSEGAHVAVVDRDADAAADTVAQLIRDGGSASAHVLDLTDEFAVEATIAEVMRAHGQLDIAVNNAGIGGAMAPLADYPLEAWREVIDINLTSVFLCLRAELRAMTAAGVRGSIVNTASIMSSIAMEGISGYVASKHAVLGLTRAAALEYGPSGIRVNAVAPSFSRVGFTAESLRDDTEWERMAAQHPLRRTTAPTDVAAAVAYLASTDASFVNGHLLNVDGGYLTQ